MININKMKQSLQPGIYKHHKGGTYRVHFVATHSETLEKFVVYELIEDNRTDRNYVSGTIWIRPFAMFTEIVTYRGKQVPRFKLITKN